MKQNYLDLELAELIAFAAAEQLPPYKAKQLYRWQTRAVASFDELSDQSKSLRAHLEECFYPGLPELKERFFSKQSDSEKYVLALADGQVVEAVLMRHAYGNSLCLSSQAGCAMGCRFCASAGISFGRNLSRGELLGQFILAEKLCGEKIHRLDLMGIGEPLANYDEIIAFIRRLKDAELFSFSPRHITLSTCGLVPEIRRLAGEGMPLNLAISLHAPKQALREKLMPVAKRYPLGELLAAADEYFEKTGRRVSYEYALFAEVNDQVGQARELAALLKGKNCHVNLIPANEVPGTGLRAAKKERLDAFAGELEKRGIPVSVRRSLGQDITAACGQLRRSRLLAQDQGGMLE